MDQLTALAYRKSAHTFITNGDCLKSAQELTIPSYSTTLHGLDDVKVVPDTSLRPQLLQEHGVDRLYLCSLRHDWKVKGTDQYIRALPEIVRRTGPRFRLFMSTWGQQVEESRQLARELGVDSYIVWKAPLPRLALLRWYGAMDCVFDQIALPHFGCTAPEALGCAVPVIMSYDPEATAWIIPEPAPILSAWGPEEIANHVASLTDPDYRAEVGQRGREWFLRNHTSQRLLEDHLRVYQNVCGAPEAHLKRAA
jgi:glycosyltransferase involved in cell wall biosynthesis